MYIYYYIFIASTKLRRRVDFGGKNCFFAGKTQKNELFRIFSGKTQKNEVFFVFLQNTSFTTRFSQKTQKNLIIEVAQEPVQLWAVSRVIFIVLNII